MQGHTQSKTNSTPILQPTGQKIYAQLRPHAEHLLELEAVQTSLPMQSNGRMIGPDELHLTLIHFGKADDMFEKVSEQTAISRQEFDEQLTRYITRTTALLPTSPIPLEFEKFDLFGPKHNTLVARFRQCEILCALHAKLLAVLVEFFKDIRIPDPIEFMTNDPNFRSALECKPRVTLYKGYEGDVPTGKLSQARFESMEVAY